MRQNGYCWSKWSRPMRKKCNILWFVWSIALKVYNRHNNLTSRYWFYLRLRICFILLLSWLLLIFAFHLLFVSADFLRILTSECVADHERTPKYQTYIIYCIVSEAENSSYCDAHKYYIENFNGTENVILRGKHTTRRERQKHPPWKDSGPPGPQN